MNIQTLSANKLLAAIDSQDRVVREFVDTMINAGRGHERMDETREAAKRGFDPLAFDYVAAMSKASDLETERKYRLQYHGKLSPVKRS